MPTGQRVDPYRNFRFKLELQGIVHAQFTECSGFGSNIEVIEYREGGGAPTVLKLPGKMSFPDIVLKWGLTDSRTLYDWHLAAVNGKIKRTDGSIILLDDAGDEKVRWNFYNAWPSKWDGPDFNAKGNDVAIDSLTISCERVERV
ncbi:MAG TPA: phage tail protein [candidate division Zixibacteria bacterium]|nr:phage tail protein [candidate division Zixibacteria bacterium]